MRPRVRGAPTQTRRKRRNDRPEPTALIAMPATIITAISTLKGIVSGALMSEKSLARGR